MPTVKVNGAPDKFVRPMPAALVPLKPPNVAAVMLESKSNRPASYSKVLFCNASGFATCRTPLEIEVKPLKVFAPPP